MALPLSIVAKSKKDDAEAPAEPRPSGYFNWSREPAMGLFAVLPLWIAYIVMRWTLAPNERNGAELLLLQQVGRLGGSAHLYVSAGFAVLIAFAARWAHMSLCDRSQWARSHSREQ